VCLGLPRGRIKIQTQQMKHAQKWPDVGGGDGPRLKVADDLLQFAAIPAAVAEMKPFVASRTANSAHHLLRGRSREGFRNVPGGHWSRAE